MQLWNLALKSLFKDKSIFSNGDALLEKALLIALKKERVTRELILMDDNGDCVPIWLWHYVEVSVNQRNKQTLTTSQKTVKTRVVPMKRSIAQANVSTHDSKSLLILCRKWQDALIQAIQELSPFMTLTRTDPNLTLTEQCLQELNMDIALVQEKTIQQIFQ